MTLLELLIALTVMVLVVGTLAALSRAVQLGAEYSDGYGTATQHGRVCIERITRTVNGATANELFPGFLVLAEETGQWRFPDALVVWHPQGAAADPDGLPRYNELVIYGPNPASPGQLLEITVPDDSRQAPAATDLAAWATAVESIRDASASQKIPLTDLLRTSPVAGASSTTLHGAIRFESRLRPSDAQWTQYQSGTLAWEDLPWVQGIYGSETGLRQAWLRLEMQLLPSQSSSADGSAGQPAIAFFGSAAVYYKMNR